MGTILLQICETMPTLKEVRDIAQKSLNCLRTDHKRALNPTPYKVSTSSVLFVVVQILFYKDNFYYVRKMIFSYKVLSKINGIV